MAIVAPPVIATMTATMAALHNSASRIRRAGLIEAARAR
jgi:hypothetical protein